MRVVGVFFTASFFCVRIARGDSKRWFVASYFSWKENSRANAAPMSLWCHAWINLGETLMKLSLWVVLIFFYKYYTIHFFTQFDIFVYNGKRNDTKLLLLFGSDIKYRSIIHAYCIIGVCDFIFRTDAQETKFQLQHSTTSRRCALLNFSHDRMVLPATTIFHAVESTSSGMWNAMSIATALNVKCIVKYL